MEKLQTFNKTIGHLKLLIARSINDSELWEKRKAVTLFQIFNTHDNDTVVFFSRRSSAITRAIIENLKPLRN